ncbi:MAG: UDP-N-acetylglucosamine 2-epimerase [Candidatus Peribacteraceae bacterium]|nr:UDP-N-acetylglucosamine 2-epimerase [Candidatus Peribacteraceae bacterium]
MEEITYLSQSFYKDIASANGKHVHVIMIATKPDIIKQVPLYNELKSRGHVVVLGHTGQHYDENLSGGMLKEFGVEPDFNLNVRGSAYEVVSQIIGRLGYVFAEIKEGGKIVIPYVHGDTTTAMAASNAGYCHRFASVHVEAGIRTLTPAYEKCRIGDPSKWREFLMDRNNWERGSQEPFPEQFNTRCSEAATGIHLAPVELDKEFMLSEGYAQDRIFVVGNSVADALRQAQGKLDESTIFERFPQLADGNFVRFCIHRGENCSSEKRFRAIYEAMKSLILDGRKVLFISLFKTESALKEFGLKEEIDQIAKDYSNFVYSSVWAEYGDVIAAMNKAAVCATDSGSMQEEMNVLGVPCVTLRFGSDRPESAIAGGNLIAPPVDSSIIKSLIEYAWNNKEMKSAPKIYGENVSAKCVDTVEEVLAKGEVFREEEERLEK